MSTFVKVPTFVMELACAGDISPQALRLYVVLRSYQNHENRKSWPSFATLADRLNIPHRQNINRYMAELTTSGAVIKSNRSGTSSVYTFPDSAQTVIRGDYSEASGVIASDYSSWDEAGGVITNDYRGESSGLTGVITSDDTGVITSDSLTRSSELDQVTRPSEEEKPSSSAKSSPTQAPEFVAADAPTPVQSPLMQAVPDLPPGLDDRGRETLGRGVSKFHEAIEYLNDHRPVGHELNPAEERNLRDALRARTSPDAVFDRFTTTGARATA
ncbi:helix-turn-helix domain-containing protein [Arthrobacter cheniae]|uniref:Helix-turn-helix domain-containing protein n=1 Tax=Arthrobacter cheniae TaxID=1258888 RepID=A0A3A5M601_9MICC|nr:helix-turn-helix domain-containing protein [Arthrobacter cheniae]RJT74357.1 helix-turn-helix domain-containing protein [Arthrobacter cheniae]